MLRIRSPRAVGPLALVLLTFVAACGSDATGPRSREPLPPLVPARWFAHTADGQSLPAVVAHRLEAGVLVQHVLDSAQIDVRADGTWERRLWLSRYRAGALDARVPEVQPGRWTATDTAYVFETADGRHRFSAASMTPSDSVRVTLRGAAEGVMEGAIVATMRVLPPVVPLTGRYRATNVAGQALPARIARYDDVELDGRVLSIHILVDSALVSLRADGRYEHVVFWSEWEGPNRGEPSAPRIRYAHVDFGAWTRDLSLLRFESGWLQNHRFGGTTYDAWRMELLHGVSHGEVAVPFRYERR